MRDGDWAVMRHARSAPSQAVEGRVVLVESPGDGAGHQYQIKRLRRRDGRWLLTSDNPEGPTFEGSEDTTVIARLERVIRPEELAPTPGTVLREDDLAKAFGLEELVPATGRHGGHLFFFIDKKGMLEAPDRLRVALDGRRPSETAFVLARRDDGFRYIGIGHYRDDENRWQIPDVDFATWRRWGEGREASRALPDGALSRAQLVADALLALPESDRWIENREGRRARVLGASQGGGLRIDGGEDGFRARTVSLLDLAWVVVADDDVREHGGLLDEARVNRLRYLEGTPKGSTRWIDTGWALAAWEKGKTLVRAPAGDAGVARKVRDDDGREIDATFRVEPVGDRMTIVFESRGGTRGSKDERNTEYDTGLRKLLERLNARGLALDDALVDSNVAATLSDDERRIEAAYPLRIDDVDAVRRQLRAGQARVGRAPGAKGAGNSTKRIRLFVHAPGWSQSDLGRYLETGTASDDG